MPLTIGCKLLLATLSCFLSDSEDLTFNEAKSQVVNQYYAHNADGFFGTKTATFEISDNGFIRYRKTDLKNRSEYYSVKLSELKDACYLGGEDAGWLSLKFSDEAVIYQTYNDKAGNIDEMLNEIRIPLKNINVDEINSLCKALTLLKGFAFKL